MSSATSGPFPNIYGDGHIEVHNPPGQISVKLGNQHVDIRHLGQILTDAGEAIEQCFGSTDSVDALRKRAEAAEAKLHAIADLVNFTGTRASGNGRDMIILDFEHLKKIMNSPSAKE